MALAGGCPPAFAAGGGEFDASEGGGVLDAPPAAPCTLRAVDHSPLPVSKFDITHDGELGLTRNGKHGGDRGRGEHERCPCVAVSELLHSAEREKHEERRVEAAQAAGKSAHGCP